MKKSEKTAYSEKKNIEIAFKMMFSSVVSLRIIEGLCLCHHKTDLVFVMSWVQIWRPVILGVFGIVFASGCFPKIGVPPNHPF